MAMGRKSVSMWEYQKKLQHPVNIKCPDANAAKIIITQVGGPDGELAASMRYISQRYSMPYRDVAGLLTDIGTEELAHLEMISTIVYQLCKGLSAEELKSSGLDVYFVDHTNGIWPQAASGNAFTSAYFQSKVIQLLIYMKIWQLNKKLDQLMTIY